MLKVLFFFMLVMSSVTFAGECLSTGRWTSGSSCSFWDTQSTCDFHGGDRCEWFVPEDEGACSSTGGWTSGSHCSFWSTQFACDFHGGDSCEWGDAN